MLRDAAAQVTVNVLQVFGLRAVDIARQVEVEVVLRIADLVHWHQSRITSHVRLFGEDVDDVVDVLLAEAVLGAVLSKSFGRVDQEHALPTGGVLLVEHHDAGGDASAVEEICGEADDPLEVTGADELPTDS